MKKRRGEKKKKMRLLDTLVRFLGLDNDAPLLSLPLSMVSQRLPQRRFVVGVTCCSFFCGVFITRLVVPLK